MFLYRNFSVLLVALVVLQKDIFLVKALCGDDGRRYDIVFILDDSASVDGTEWSNQKTFCSLMIDRFSIGSDKVLVGAITFKALFAKVEGYRTLNSGEVVNKCTCLKNKKIKGWEVHDGVKVITNPGSYTTASNIKSVINSATHRNVARSNYGVGAWYAYHTMLANYKRSNTIRVVIGISDDPQDWSSTMNSLFNSGDNDKTIFMMVSWSNSHVNYARADYFWNSVSITSAATANEVAAKVCPTCGDDGRKIDIIFGIDYSGSVDAAGWIAQKNYIYTIIDQMAISTNRVYVGVLLITDSYQLVYNLGDHRTGTDCKAAIEALTAPTGSSNYEQGAYYAYYTMLAYYRRSGSLGVIIGLTDDHTGISGMTYISTALSNGDYFYMVGVGGDKSAGATNSNYYWQVTAWTDLTSALANEAAVKICSYCTTPASKSNAGYTSGGLMYLDTTTYACNTGYQGSGTSTSTCQKDGTWSTSTYVCTIRDCGTPPSKSHASYTNTGTTYQSTATYSCNTGYSASTTSTTINCQSTGVWSTTSLVCTIKDCGNPAAIAHATYTTTGTTYLQTATYSCNTGYDPNAGAASITCLATGNWGSTSFGCIIKDCGSPPVVPDSSKTQTGTTYLSTATYTCNANYVLTSTPSTITCLATGSWETISFSCIYDCLAPAGITDGTVSYTTTTDGSTATYACDLGYNPSTPSLTITCVVGGWPSISHIFCTINDCLEPPDLPNAEKAYTTTTYLSIATYTCHYGHNENPSTSNMQISCTPTVWETFPFSCDPNDCGIPQSVVNGEPPTYVDTIYPYNATYECSLGYHLSDPTLGSIMCGPVSWDAITFTCEPNDCGTPPSLLNAVESYTKTTYLERVQYNCDPGHDPSTGFMYIVCEPYAWENITFECIPKDCGLPMTDIDNAVKVYTETIFYTVDTSEVHYMCSLGHKYEPETSTGIIKCQVTGVWETVAFECIFSYCKNISKEYKDPSVLSVTNDGMKGRMYFLNDTLYQADCCGVISGWEFEPETEGFFNLMVWRPGPGTKWTLIGFNTVLITNSSLPMNFTVPSGEKIVVQAGDQVGWYFEGGSMIKYDTCDVNVDPDCPQLTMHAPGPGDLTEGWVYDWEAAGQVLPGRAYGIKFYFTANTKLVFNESQYNTSIPDHWSIGQAVMTISLSGVDYAEEANYTIAPLFNSMELFSINSFGNVKIANTLPRSKVVDTFHYNLTAVDYCQNFAWTTILIQTFNAPPLFTNLPSKIEIDESISANVDLFKVGVKDPTNDPICCTIEKVLPQTENFALSLNGSTLNLATGAKPVFSYKTVDSYLVRVCCQDEEYGASGVLQVTVKGPVKTTTVPTPGWFLTAMIASIVPIAIMFLSSCTLLFYTTFGL